MSQEIKELSYDEIRWIYTLLFLLGKETRFEQSSNGPFFALSKKRETGKKKKGVVGDG